MVWLAQIGRDHDCVLPPWKVCQGSSASGARLPPRRREEQDRQPDDPASDDPAAHPIEPGVHLPKQLDCLRSFECWHRMISFHAFRIPAHGVVAKAKEALGTGLARIIHGLPALAVGNS
jgi:hypothetical protein